MRSFILGVSLSVASCCAVVHAAPTGTSIRGRVLSVDDLPVAHVELEAFDIDSSAPLGRAVTDGAGRFTFRAVADGEFLLLARKDGHPSVARTITVADREGEVVLRLDPAVPELVTEISVVGDVPRRAASETSIRASQLDRIPIDDAGDVLRHAPGLVVARHGGGGKSDQYLIRGIDADHGTDIALSVDGIPINIVSHAHGQGYADLGFLIPEMLEEVEVKKGPYYAEHGNLATGGAVSFRLRESFETSRLEFHTGAFGQRRVFLGYSPELTRAKALVALEHRKTDGPFENPQRFRKLNLAARFRFDLTPRQNIALLATTNSARWNASGQIPLRQVESGALDHFGAIDPSEGGETSRYNVSATYRRFFDAGTLEAQVYGVHYELDLFSNFTFFAHDAVRGDGIFQTDTRNVLGGRLQAYQQVDVGMFPISLTVGSMARRDVADVGLSRQHERVVFETTVDSRVHETNVGVFAEGTVEIHPRVRAALGLRYDHLRFETDDNVVPGRHGQRSSQFLGAKASLTYTLPSTRGEVYANYGRGFHSNDARSAVLDPDAAALAVVDGYEVGYRQTLVNGLELGLVYWWLDSAGELTWVGDEGTTALVGPTRRHGPEIDVSWTPRETVRVDASAFYASADFRDNSDVVARAPRFAFHAGATVTLSSALSGGASVRHVGNHPITEDATAFAEGYTTSALFARYRISASMAAVVNVENLFDVDVKEAQTYFESRLPSELRPVPDNHFTPGSPRAIRVGVEIQF